MDYQSCLEMCIAALSADAAHAKQTVQTYSTYPTPSDTEWTDILETTAAYDDPNDPFACMGQYEIRLSRQGVETALGSYVKEMRAAAARAGVPEAYVEDAITLFHLVGLEGERFARPEAIAAAVERG